MNTSKIETACHAANTQYLSGYGKISSFIRSLQDQSIPLEDIEHGINDAIVKLDKDDVSKLDKAYQMASKRILGHTFGLKWNEDDDRGEFHIPESRNKPKDAFKVAVAKFLASNPSDEDKQTVVNLMKVCMANAQK